MNSTILSIKKLYVEIQTDSCSFNAVSNLNFQIKSGQTVCIVGESGCGKSLTAKSILGLLPQTGKASGEIFFNNADLLTISQSKLRQIRGKQISMIFQEPMTALNPVLKIGSQVMEPLKIHYNMPEKEATLKAIELLQQVGIAEAKSRLNDYPHQLSGGMRQRVMIAMALACDPVLLLADEPTTALDVTTQKQILNLIKKLSQKRAMSVLFITHDLEVVARIADTVIVMYAGYMVEQAAVKTLLENPLHPYTKGLIKAAPTKNNMLQKRLQTIPGLVPNLANMPKGCPFSPRCEHRFDKCIEQPPLILSDDHKVACWLYS